MSETARQVVVDASAVIELLVQGDRADGVADALMDRALTAPAHLDAEVLSALARLARLPTVGAVEASLRLAMFASMPIQRHALAPLLQGAWARSGHVSTYDGLYIELAEVLGVPLVTCDRGLASATSRAVLIN